MNLPLLTTLTATLLLAACATPEPPGPAGHPIQNPISPRPAIVLADYGQLVSFHGDKTLRYPDFNIVFQGTRLGRSELLPAHILNFQVSSHSGRAVALTTWHPSSGDSNTFILEGRPYRFSVEVDTLQIAVHPGR